MEPFFTLTVKWLSIYVIIVSVHIYYYAETVQKDKPEIYTKRRHTRFSLSAYKTTTFSFSFLNAVFLLQLVFSWASLFCTSCCIFWFVSLSNTFPQSQPILYLNNVTEGDAGTYICRVSNNRATVEARAILRVLGVVPSFKGSSWAALPTIADAYRQFDIEVSFKPIGKDLFTWCLLYGCRSYHVAGF